MRGDGGARILVVDDVRENLGDDARAQAWRPICVVFEPFWGAR
jgi:hypothetical protein